MKIKTLIEFLKKENPEADVDLSSDAEGNNYHRIGSFVKGKGDNVILFPDDDYLEEEEMFDPEEEDDE